MTDSAWLAPSGDFVTGTAPQPRRDTPRPPAPVEPQPAAPPATPAEAPTAPAAPTADDAIISMLRQRVHDLEEEAAAAEQTIASYRTAAEMRAIVEQSLRARTVAAEQQVAALRPALEALVGIRALLESVRLDVTACGTCGTIGGHLTDCPEAG